MKFRFEHFGSRGECDITFGDIKELDTFVDMYVVDRERMLIEEDDVDYVNEFMEMKFGGITEECFVEISYGEEECVLIYLEEV